MPSASPSATATIMTSSSSEPPSRARARARLAIASLGVVGGLGGLGGLGVAGASAAAGGASAASALGERLLVDRLAPGTSVVGRRRGGRLGLAPRDRAAGPARRSPPGPCSGARARGRACRRGRAGSRASRGARRRGRRPRCARSSASARGNVRSTPTPKDCLRTVKVSRTPSPWRLMTTPSKTCVRRRVPSMTWKCTRTRSPAWNCGTRRSCARSRLSMTVLMAKKKPREPRERCRSGGLW